MVGKSWVSSWGKKKNSGPNIILTSWIDKINCLYPHSNCCHLFLLQCLLNQTQMEVVKIPESLRLNLMAIKIPHSLQVKLFNSWLANSICHLHVECIWKWKLLQEKKVQYSKGGCHRGVAHQWSTVMPYCTVCIWIFIMFRGRLRGVDWVVCFQCCHCHCECVLIIHIHS